MNSSVPPPADGGEDDGYDAEYEEFRRHPLGRQFFPVVILLLSFVGIVSNVASLFIFTRQKFRKDFHRLLMILALYDLLVSTSLLEQQLRTRTAAATASMTTRTVCTARIFLLGSTFCSAQLKRYVKG